MIPYGKQNISQQDIEAVVDVLQSNYLTQGPQVPRFEQAIREYCGANYAVAVNSATSALHIACLALGLKEGDWLWTSPITFVASANCALYCCAKVDFVDIDPRTNNLSICALEIKLEQAAKENRLPKVLVPVHLSGQSCDMEAINRLAKKYQFRVIEDASHAVGGRYEQESIGGCRYSDITVFSFHPVKIITSAEGGMALTNNVQLAEKMERLRSHGITRDPKLMTHEPDGEWYYQQLELGFNYRMTELQAALGLSQFNRLDVFVARRHEISDRYNKLLQELPVATPYQAPNTHSGLHLYIIRLRLDCIDVAHEEVFRYLRENGVGVNLHYIPVHTQPYYQQMGFQVGDFPEAEKYYSEAISLPMYPGLSFEEQDKVVDVLKSAFSGRN